MTRQSAPASGGALVCPVQVGRAPQLEALAQLLGQARAARGQTALVSGEAGVGKSRLLAESVRRANGFLAVRGTCYETDRAVPYAPFVEVLREPGSEAGRERMQAALAAVPGDFYYLLPEVAPATGPSPHAPFQAEAKHRLHDSLAHLFFHVAARIPLLLVIEDLHWCDDTSLEMLLYLARRISGQRILLLLTYRDDETSAPLEHFLAELDRARLAHEIPLARLSVDELDEMIRAIFGMDRPVRAEFLTQIHALTDGNPFFVEEVLKSLVGSGDIFYADGAWDRRPMHQLHIPRSVHDAVRHRAERMSAEARRVLALAAVIGKQFDFPLMRALTGYSEAELLPPIKEMIGAQLVVETALDRFSFRHALTRQAVYADLLARERASLHRVIADNMVRLSEKPGDLNDAELAYHYYEGGAWREALEHSLRAGERARALDAPRAASEHFTRAVDAARQLGLAPAPAVLRARGLARETLGEFDGARDDLEHALAGSRASAEPRAEWETLIELGKLWTSRDYRSSGTYFQTALSLARAIGDPASVAHSLNRIGNWHSNLDQPLEALVAHRESLAIFRRQEDQNGIAESADLLGMANYIGGDLDSATACFAEATALFRNSGDRRGLVSALAALSARSATYKTEALAAATPLLADADVFGEEALQVARAIEWRAGEAFALWCLGASLGGQGDCGPALQYCRDALRLSEAIEHRQWSAAALRMLGGIHYDLLALPDAISYLQRSLALATESGSRHWVRVASAALALAHIAQNELSQAQVVLDAALPASEPMHSIGRRQCWVARAELALARLDAGQALRIAEDLIGTAAHGQSSAAIPRLLKLRADALAARHDPSAAPQYVAARQAAGALGALPLQWRIDVGLGFLYQRESQPEQAEQSFAAARATVERIAASLPAGALREDFGGRANALIPAARAQSARQLAKKEHGGLTGRERQIAAMIAQGGTNREIAAKLVLSERTVETHVGNILGKLGFTSRAQIAGWSVAQRLAGDEP